jgi:hypothetical protein
MLDLDRVERVINRPHVIDLRPDGWTLMHPPACHPNLFACPVNEAAGAQLDGPPDEIPFGRYFCELDEWGNVAIGGEADDSEGVDWTALVAEAWAAREVIEAVRRWEIGDEWTGIMAALAAYDKVTGEATTDAE